MNNDWKYNAIPITKYNPAFRDKDGEYTKEEWIGFFQVGKTINGKLFTFEDYLEVEKKYVTAVELFFKFHNCGLIEILNLEKPPVYPSSKNDEVQFFEVFTKLSDGFTCNVEDLRTVVKLILREVIWAELCCSVDKSQAVRFGYDYYMYFNSTADITQLLAEVELLGLYTK